jgi:hypothetical protein
MGSPAPDIEKRYTNRPDGTIPMCISLDREAVRILRESAAGPRAYGKFLSVLLYEHRARAEARQEARREIAQQIRESVTPILGMLSKENASV